MYSALFRCSLFEHSTPLHGHNNNLSPECNMSGIRMSYTGTTFPSLFRPTKVTTAGENRIELPLFRPPVPPSTNKKLGCLLI